MSNTPVDLLPLEKIVTFVASDDNWTYEDDCLKTAFQFATFEEAIEVVNKVAAVCSEMDHHPLMTNVYNQLTFSLCTHRVGDKVTELDVALAERISEIMTSHKELS